MARFWKEPYTLERAMAIGIRENQNIPVLIHEPNSEWHFRGSSSFLGAQR
jgi:hypothetical protein